MDRWNPTDRQMVPLSIDYLFPKRKGNNYFHNQRTAWVIMSCDESNFSLVAKSTSGGTGGLNIFLGQAISDTVSKTSRVDHCPISHSPRWPIQNEHSSSLPPQFSPGLRDWWQEKDPMMRDNLCSGTRDPQC